MAVNDWPTKSLAVTSLHLDQRNPRLGRETTGRAPRDIIQHLFEHDKAIEVARSIQSHGYFPNEPVLAVKEDDRYVVVEGNRRLAALKALNDPTLLDGAIGRRVEALARRIANRDDLKRVPVTIAPSRRATDRLLAARHIGTPVLSWQVENRASFILDKIAEGYDNARLSGELGFSASDIQKARQIRAIADIARSLPLSDEQKGKLDNPRALFTTIERVLDSQPGRDGLRVAPDLENGFVIQTSPPEFTRGFQRLVEDILGRRATSRTLNTNDQIKAYFDAWPAEQRVAARRGTHLPSEVISGKSVASRLPPATVAPAKPPRSRPMSSTVLPKDLKILVRNDRLIDVRSELTKLKRGAFPNAGAVLLRVFFELCVVDYLERIGELDEIVAKLEKAQKRKLPYGTPTIGQLIPELERIAKERLTSAQANGVRRALRTDAKEPFSLGDFHAFVHRTTDFPGDRDMLEFWSRTEPLFRLMLEQDAGVAPK